MLGVIFKVGSGWIWRVGYPGRPYYIYIGYELFFFIQSLCIIHAGALTRPPSRPLNLLAGSLQLIALGCQTLTNLLLSRKIMTIRQMGGHREADRVAKQDYGVRWSNVTFSSWSDWDGCLYNTVNWLDETWLEDPVTDARLES